VAARVEAAAAVAAQSGFEAVVVCGDVTHAGDAASTRVALERLSACLERRVLLVAGNHDCLERDDQLERWVNGSVCRSTIDISYGASTSAPAASCRRLAAAQLSRMRM
jgi:metallophosphoesterase superfamily enzyme